MARRRNNKASKAKTIRVFVYGSLLQGLGNHRVLDGADFMGENATKESAFHMHSLGYFPACARVGRGGERIYGECYRVNRDGLERLDQLEGHPRFYRREPVTMKSGARAWMYLIDKTKIEGQQRVRGGSWARFLAGECDEVSEEVNVVPDYTSEEYNSECDEVSEEEECDGECEECGKCLDWSPEPTILYFAYGSNLDLEQMRRRCPDSRLVGSGTLPGTRIAFAGHSRSWGGAVATIVPEKESACDGLVFACTPSDIRRLDACEGFPHCYDRARLTIEMDNGTVCKAWTYFLPLTRKEGAPSDAYLSQIWDAYVTNNFDLDRLIDAVEAA